MKYSDFEKILEEIKKDTQRYYNIGSYIYDSQEITLKNKNGEIILDDVNYYDEIEDAIIEEFEPMEFWVCESRDGNLGRTQVSLHREEFTGNIIKLYKATGRTPGEVLENPKSWKEIKK